MRGVRLLVVDDDSATLWALRSIFSRKGCEVVTARTLAEGLLALEGAPDCLILDLDLPDGRGESLLGAVRSRRLPTRVAVCSGLDDPARIARVMAMKPEALLAKPYDLAPVFHLCGLAS